MAAFVLLLGVTIAVGLVISSAISFWFASRHKDALEELGVSPTYPRSPVPDEKIEAYLEQKEKFREQFAKDAPDDNSWMCNLPPQAKDMLKYRLMQRAIGGMSLLQKIDADARGYWKLFSKGIVTSQFWNSVLAAERQLSQEIEAVKAEAMAIEPRQDPQGIIAEAMQFVSRFGDKVWDMFPEPPSMGAGPGGNGEAIAKAAQAVAAAAAAGGRMPPGMLPPGMPRPTGSPGPNGAPRPMMPPGMPPGPPGPPPPQKGGEEDAYNWKQDGEEVEVSVHVPKTATKAEVKVQFQPKTLKVLHCGKPLVEGALAAPCVPEGCTWTLSNGNVVVTLEKANPRPWPGLFAEKS